MLAEALFKVFDDDNSGTFSFEEYYQVAGCTTIMHNNNTQGLNKSVDSPLAAP